MRLHRLRIESFGPFAGVEHVDFDLLAEGGLFLLHGPTGAGKTSVLDAVCFALYGQVPGARAAGRPRLRSDHAADGAAPRVVLELTVGGRHIEVTRSPEWARPKKRGSGTTREPASTDVRELVDGQWQVRVGRRSDEAGRLLRDLLGMGLEQFTKVVLLPQGEFAAFLRAGADERAELLGRLFAIDRYVGVESWLRAERQHLAASVQSADAEQEAILARAQEAVHDLDDVQVVADAELALAGPPGPPLLRALAAAAAGEHRQALASARAARTAAEQAQERLGLSRADDDRYRRYRGLIATRDALLAGEPEHQEQVRRYESAERAAQLLPLLRRLQAAADELQRQDVAWASAYQAVAPLLAGVPVPDEPVPDELAVLSWVERLVLQRQQNVAQLEAVSGTDDEVAEVTERLTRATADRDAAMALAAAAEVAAAAAEEQFGSSSAVLAATTERAGALTTAEQALVAALDVLGAATELDAVRTVLETQQGTVHAARDRELVDRRRVLDVRERRLDGMAAELAASLVAGAPCAVCGSEQHPAPARPTDRFATEHDEGDARAVHEESLRALRAAERALVDLDRTAAVLRQRARSTDPSAAAAAVEQARQAVGDAQEAADLVPTLRRSVDQAQSAVLAANQRRQAAERQVAAASSAITELTPRVERLRVAVARACGDDPDLPSRRARLDRELRALTLCREAARRRTTASRQHAASRDDLTSAAGQLGMDAPPSPQEVLDDDERAELRDATAAYAAGLVAVQAQLDALEPDLLALDGGAPHDGDATGRRSAAVAAALTQAEDAARDAAAVVQRCEHRLAVAARADQALARLGVQLQQHVDRYQDLRARHARVDELSRCVDGTGGGNARRMRLSAFVLAARLEEVAAAASERLLVMSDGRYALRHSDELARAGARSGLGLAVVDGWTGIARETTTLSGGESFLASLALALGLADVLQAEAGGTRIDTLFVDEGFGSLDEAALDDVMGVLDGLREGGRCVGVVSHVTELRDRIPTRLQVTKSRVGSRLHASDPEICRAVDRFTPDI